MAGEFQVVGKNRSALFTLKLHRGDGMALLGMNWKNGPPPKDFVGFAISYRPPKEKRFFVLKNRLSFEGTTDGTDKTRLATTRSPIQKFRWVHFPRNAELQGEFVYRVTPVFMNASDELSYGEAQEAAIALARETYPGRLNVTYTRGFVSSQAFVDRYAPKGDKSRSIATLLPRNADDGLDFRPTHPDAKEALAWMGFEARSAIIETLDQAIADRKAEVLVVAYDLSEAGVVSRLAKLGPRLKIIIDDSGTHKKSDSGESKAAKRLIRSAGKANVIRQHMGQLQHNKTIIVDGPRVRKVVCGSTNFSWRGFFVQSNNAMILEGAQSVRIFRKAFDDYFGNAKGFTKTSSARWNRLGLRNIDARVAFSPHSSSNALLDAIGKDVGKATSCVFYSLAFLSQTKGAIRKAITSVTKDKRIFVYGISDKKTGGFDLLKPDGNVAPVNPTALAKNVPLPFKAEPTGGSGNRMHHKFVVIDFDKPTARVYLGSYNFSPTADTKNGENLLLINDRRVAVSYMIEALRIFDHYHFRVISQKAKRAKKKLTLAKPPRKAGEAPWWSDSYKNARKIRDRELFA